jgi:crotonyl-CoA carboxylase/reductase
VHHGWWDPDDPSVLAGKDPMLAPSARIWGYDWPRNYGSFAQFCIAQAHQVMPKAGHLTMSAQVAPSRRYARFS